MVCGWVRQARLGGVGFSRSAAHPRIEEGAALGGFGGRSHRQGGRREGVGYSSQQPRIIGTPATQATGRAERGNRQRQAAVAAAAAARTPTGLPDAMPVTCNDCSHPRLNRQGVSGRTTHGTLASSLSRLHLLQSPHMAKPRSSAEVLRA